MYYQPQIFNPMCNFGSEPQKATDGPGESGYTVLHILREEGGKREPRSSRAAPIAVDFIFILIPCSCCFMAYALPTRARCSM